MQVYEIDPQNVSDPRELTVNVLPSPISTSDANWLLIYTGLIGDLTHAGGYSQSGNLHRARIILNLSRLHNRKFDGHPFKLVFLNGRLEAAPVASLAAVAADKGGIVFAVDEVDVDEDNQELRLLVDIAVQGEAGSLHKISYQVSVLAHGPH